MAARPEDRKLTYPSLMSVMRHVNYDKRSEVSIYSPELCKIHKRLGYSLNSLSFNQKHGDVNEDGVPEEVGSAELNVESIKYRFQWDPVTEKVEIQCSLNPGRELYVEDISIGRNYFHHYLTKSKRPVERLFLTECDRPFRNLVGLQNKNIKWNLSEVREYPLFQDFQDDHIFEKLEFSGYGSLLLTEKQVRNCKHLVLKKEDIYIEYVIGNEERTIKDHYCTLTNSKLELHLGLNHMESFLLLCERILLDIFQIDSAFTAVFKRAEFLKEYAWSSLLGRFEQARKGVLKLGECVVLQLTNDHIIAVFTNYYGKDDMHTESFTVVKLNRHLDMDSNDD